MTETEKLLRDIETLRASIQHGWMELGTKSLTKEERANLRQHLEWCADELKELLKRLWELDEQ